MSKVRVNYKSDLPPIEVKFKINGEDVNVPDHDFSIRFFVDGMPGVSFECGYKNGEFINCEKTAADTLTCYIDNHGFGCGRLCCEYIDLAKSNKYSDGIRKTVTPNRLDIILVEGEGDDIVSITSSVVIDIAALIADVEAALEEMEGYADIIAALQAAVATIPDVIDDLETGGHTDALSAEQGKILKEILDNLGRISVEGITGFTPISSLNELPENPTTEQKRQAYLFENALYVYVGAGGDTLDGKYQSVELVNLDWGDKSYNTSEFSGLGRRWLKKNVVDDKNVLTSAMIGTANTEYFIQYDYDLNGATVTLPANASLVFMGGSIKNGTLIGNNTRIQAKKGVCIFDGITIKGTWDVTEAYSSWFKMHKKGYKIKDVTEAAITLYKGTDNNYYDFDDLTLVGSDYYVTSTLVGGEVVESSIKVTAATYATFRVEGYNTDSTIDYVAAPAGVPGTFDASGYAQYDDSSSLQSLFDIRAKKTVVEEGIYMVMPSQLLPSHNIGVYYDGVSDSELVIEGWLKEMPINYLVYNTLFVKRCDNVRITGNGGIQGDLLDRTGADNTEWGHIMYISDTKDLCVDGLTFAYACGDCVIASISDFGRFTTTNDQSNHTYKNVKFLYGGRTGFVSEYGNNFVIDSCYFQGTGRIRPKGVGTWSAVDIEPFTDTPLPMRYVRNYEFKNSIFKGGRNGLRTERCIDCSIHDNIFDSLWTGVLVQLHRDVDQDQVPNVIKPRMSITNNNLRKCDSGITLTNGYQSENIIVSGNLLTSCAQPIKAVNYAIKNCKIFDNTFYGCGKWYFQSLIDCDIYNNRSYACKMSLLGLNYGAELIGGFPLIHIYSFSNCKNSKFHDNTFSLDMGTPMLGLTDGAEQEIYHGLPLATDSSLVQSGQNSRDGVPLDQPQKIHFYENKVSDDFSLFPSNVSHPTKGINSVKDENSEVFLLGDTFKSSYGDEGVVTSGAILSYSWLDNLNGGDGPREFEAGMEVSYGEIIKLGDRYKVCMKAGECGETLTVDQQECGSAKFLKPAGYTAPVGSLFIRYKTRGICTSATRPSTFLFSGRWMYETDTRKTIIYNGSEWEEM